MGCSLSDIYKKDIFPEKEMINDSPIYNGMDTNESEEQDFFDKNIGDIKENKNIKKLENINYKLDKNKFINNDINFLIKNNIKGNLFKKGDMKGINIDDNKNIINGKYNKYNTYSKAMDKDVLKFSNKISIKRENTFNIIRKKNRDNNIINQNKEDKNKKMIDELIKKEINYKSHIKNLEDEISKLKLQNEPILVGLNNIGATCYMNATLQCLSNTKKLTEYFLKEFKYDNPNKKMTYEYYKVIKKLWNRDNNNKSYSPNSFKEVLSQENELFAGIQANDSKDLINFLIERFHQELNIINKKITNNDNEIMMQDQTNENMMLKIFIKEFSENYNSPISNLFYGIIETKSQCSGCNIIKFNFQLFSFLEFPLQQVNQYFFNNGKKIYFLQKGKNPDVDLYECFEYNRKIDLMNGENQMFCNKCNKLCDATYTTLIYSCPIYLIINLNRGKGAVYECKVIFPEQLNIINFVSFQQGITVYELYAVICHLGPSSMSGHFVAYCKNSVDHKWYLYNDAFVSLCTKPQQYNDGMPYILFYKAAQDGT